MGRCGLLEINQEEKCDKAKDAGEYKRKNQKKKSD